VGVRVSNGVNPNINKQSFFLSNPPREASFELWVGLYNIFFHFWAFVHKSILLALPLPPASSTRGCNTIAILLRTIRALPIPDFMPYSIQYRALQYRVKAMLWAHYYTQLNRCQANSRLVVTELRSEKMYLCMYVKIRRHQHTRVHAHTQARGATPELWRVADTTSHGLSAGRHSTQTTIGSQ